MSPSSSTVRVGVIGFGPGSPNHVRHVAPLCDGEATRARAASITHRGPPCLPWRFVKAQPRP